MSQRQRFTLPAFFFAPCLLVLTAAVLLASGCGPNAEEAADIAVTWTVVPDPPVVGPATVAVVLADSAGRPVSDARVVLEGTMTHPGMRPARAEAQETTAGHYETVMDFSMSGDWILLLEATLPDGRTLRRQRDLRGVRAP